VSGVLTFVAIAAGVIVFGVLVIVVAKIVIRQKKQS
jgi:hypothetical protein